MKFFLVLCLAVGCGLVRAESSPPATNAPAQQIEINSDSGYFDGKSSQMIYLGSVVVTDHEKATLHCGKLTVDVPLGGGELTNIVAETNVVIDYLDNKGFTNTIFSDKAVYTYSVVTNVSQIVTNKLVNFYGGDPMPKVVSPNGTFMAAPLTYDFIAKTFGGPHFHGVANVKLNNGTNASPLNFLK